MNSLTRQDAECLYLDVYGLIAENADYLEPEEGPDLLLSEAILASLRLPS